MGTRDKLIKSSVLGELPAGEEEKLSTVLLASPDDRMKWRQLKRIARAFSEMPPEAPPEDFTDRVMCRLPVSMDPGLRRPSLSPGSPRRRSSVWRRLPEYCAGVRYKFYNEPTTRAGNEINAGSAREAGAVRKTECVFCFFITGFFYLIMGIVAIVGLRGVGAGGWIWLQPYLALATGIWLFGLGAILMVDGVAGIRAAKYGALFYAIFAVMNGIWIRPYVHAPHSGLFTIGFVATCTLIGIMLTIAVDRIELACRMKERQFMKKRFGNDAGFTLIEIVAVLLVLAIASAVVLSRGNPTNTADTTAEMNNLRGHLRFAQFRAMNDAPTVGCPGGVNWGINVGTSSYTLVRVDCNGTTYPLALPGDSSATHTFAGGVTAAAATVLFNSWGSPGTTYNSSSASSLTVSVGSSSITITAGTGFIP